jgi:hypothetical protein
MNRTTFPAFEQARGADGIDRVVHWEVGWRSLIFDHVISELREALCTAQNVETWWRTESRFVRHADSQRSGAQPLPGTQEFPLARVL